MSRETIIADSAEVHENAVIDDGVKIGYLAAVDRYARIGKNTIVEDAVRIGEACVIGAGTKIGWEARIGRHVKIADEVVIGRQSYIGDNSKIGKGVPVGNAALILPFAEIAPDFIHSQSSNAREIGHYFTLGEGVVLHGEVEIGNNAIVPTQRTIAFLGAFGSKNRTVTIYGSDQGPLFSIGCQVGKTLPSIKENVVQHANTTSESASTYEPFLPVFDQIGTIVQAAYEKEGAYVAELKAMRQELIGTATIPAPY
jgi:UDP-3-O-[3-hydroxymyristoyl] glucosamine N-acyltransferase